LARHLAVHAAVAAAVIAAMPALAQREPAQAVDLPLINAPARVGIVPAPGQVPPAPPLDVGNTGKPDDPAAAPSRDPGDLMNAGALVYVDDSFASVDKLRTAIRSANQGQSQLAIRQFQDITKEFGQKLVLLNDGSYVSVTDYVRERLLAMPAIKTGMYDQLFGSEARREIDAAVEARDVAGLIRACDRYYPSASALKGLSQAAEWYFERGEFTAAAHTWRKAIGHPLAGDGKAQLLFSTAVAESLASNGAQAKALLERLDKEFPDATGTVAGKEVKLSGKLGEIMALPAWEKTDLSPDEWPAFEGGPSRSRLLPTNATIGARLWGYGMSNGLGTISSAAINSDMMAQREIQLLLRNGVAVSSASSSVDLGMLNSHPVISNGVLLVHSGGQLTAMSVNAGARLWAYPQDAANMDQATLQYIRNYGVNPRFTAHDSAAVYGEQVYAVLPASNPNQAGGIRYVNGMAMMPMRLVCLNRDDGSQIWSRMATEIKLEKEGQLTFVGSPLVTRQGVFVMARKTDNANFTQQYLVRLDRETGEPTWSCYLCSTNNINGNGIAAIPVPTLVDDVLYISTGQGADLAVDANAGRILWLRPTITATEQAGAGGAGGGGRGANIALQRVAQVTQLTTSWKYNPPVVIGDHVLTTDNGQMLRIYNRWTGKLLKGIPASELVNGSGSSIDVLAGALGTRVVMSISNTSVCYELDSLLDKTPRPSWSATVSNESAGRPVGRPFLSESGYYVPFTSRLVRIDNKSGMADMWEWPKNDKDESGKPGNLLVTSEQVIVVNDIEVAGYSKWETARDNRLAKIRENPKNPEPYLALAEIGFRTNHADVAQDYMKRSVEIANAGGTPPGQSNAEFLGRLYRTNLAFALQLFSKDDSALWGQTRFYFEQSKAASRAPEQQAEWRMRLADLSRNEKKPEEAVALYTEVLTDPSLRQAGYRERDNNQSAGSSAEQKIREVIKANGAEVFKRFEDQAAALTQRGSAGKDAAALQQVIDGYPNSAAAIRAATALAALHQEKQDWENARRTLFWLYPRVQGNAQAKAIADLVTVNIALKKYATAAGLTARGLRQYKDFSWTDAGKKNSFADLKEQITRLGGSEMNGTLPALRATPGAPEMQSPPEGPLARRDKELISFLQPYAVNQQLLAPVESAPGLRPSNLLFIRSGDRLAIVDTVKGSKIATDVSLGQNADTVLLGATRDAAVLLQRDRVIGVDLKSFATWTTMLKYAPPAAATRPVPRNGGSLTIRPGQNVQIVGGMVLVDGTNYGSVDAINLYDQNGNPYALAGGQGDPEMARRAAFSILGNQARFTTARILNGNVYLLGGNEISAFDIRSGKAIWPAPVLLPNGTAANFVANEDLLVAQSDDPGGKQSIFHAVDAQSGKLRKTLKLESDRGPERAVWRGLAEDGTLYVITDQAVAAYDMISDMNHAVWRRTDLGARFSGAAALTLDGLIVVSDDHDVHGLALESGESRWRSQMKLELLASSVSALRSTVEGDLVIYQSQDGSAAYLTYPSPDAERQLAWVAAKVNDPLARHSMLVSDSLAVELLQGPQPGKSASGAHLLLRDRKGGRIYTDQPVVAGRTWAVRSWQVVDGGIAFELLPASNGTVTLAGGNNATGQIYLWKTAK
jgi:outer membrane protein assembly factor BamB